MQQLHVLYNTSAADLKFAEPDQPADHEEIGSAIGFGVVTSLADDGFSSFALPADQLMIWLIVAAVAGLIASLGPARKAARLDVLRAISYE